MSINDLPTSLQAVIQQGYLERAFQKPLEAILGFRSIADRETFSANLGETITKTRRGLLPANTTPMTPASVIDFTSGLTNAQYSVEQYVLAIAQYATPMMLNVVTAGVAIDSIYLQNAAALAENAARSVDTLAQKALYDQYMGGQTRVRTTLGSAGTAVQVDDVRGFFNTLNAQGQPVVVSGTNTLSVMVGNDLYTLVSVVADGVTPTTINPWMANLAFSGSGTNVSTTPGGYSGTLNFSTNVTTADATLGNTVVAANAPFVERPYLSATNVMATNTSQINTSTYINNGKITMQMILNAKATMRANAVPFANATGNYMMYADPVQLTGLYQDPAFQFFFRGKPETPEYRKGVVAELLGVTIMETNINPVQSLGGNLVRRAALVGQGALIEGVYTDEGYRQATQTQGMDSLITMYEGIAHVTRPPLDTLQQVITQSWTYLGGFVAPTDTTTNPTTVPTASNSALKRAIILESF